MLVCVRFGFVVIGFYDSAACSSSTLTATSVSVGLTYTTCNCRYSPLVSKKSATAAALTELTFQAFTYTYAAYICILLRICFTVAIRCGDLCLTIRDTAVPKIRCHAIERAWFSYVFFFKIPSIIQICLGFHKNVYFKVQTRKRNSHRIF